MIASNIIHLIDDDSEIRYSLKLLLQLEGYSVYTYASARSFLDKIMENGSGCILADVQMPEMNGVEFLKTLKERGVFMPTIVISGLPDTEIEFTARKLGAVEYFEKPYDPDSLLAAISKVIKRFNSQVS